MTTVTTLDSRPKTPCCPRQLSLPRLRTPAFARPTMELGTAAGVLHKSSPGITEDQVRQLIERGAFWAWNVALETKDTRPDLRLLTHSVAACPNIEAMIEDQFAMAEPVPATGEEAIALLLSHASRITRSTHQPWVTGEEIKIILSIRRTHLINLVDSGALPQMPGTQYRPGPKGYPLIARETFTKFLEARLVC
jgi:hypothetical protein